MNAAGADDRGVALLNVLAIVAVGSAAALLMIASQQSGVERSTSLREAGQAQAYIRGGELSAVAALRRDMVEAPDVDHAGEAWTAIADDEVEIRGGRFSLAIVDAQDRFNLNSLAGGGLVARVGLDRAAAAAGLRPELTERIAGYLTVLGPIDSIGALSAVGLDAAGVARLSRFVVVLPPGAGVNANAASAETLGVLLQNPVAGRLLATRRAATGFLTPADFEGVGVIPPPGMGFTSDHFLVATEVQVGGARQRVVSLLRRRRVLGEPEVVVIRRRREAAALQGTPPL